MLLFAVALYFLLASLISCLVLFSDVRALLARTLAGTAFQVHRGLSALASRQRQGVTQWHARAMKVLRDIAAVVRQFRMLTLGGVLLIVLPSMFVLCNQDRTLADYQGAARETNEHVAHVLVGDLLVPPQALPPLTFETADVVRERPLLASASREWTLMRPAYARKLLATFRIMKEVYGYDMAILEGYRSPERQNLLARMGPAVTNAAAFQSWHQYGLAADCAFLRNGKLVISEKDPWAMRGYRLYGEVAQQQGLTWGGRWTVTDFGHTELRLAGVMRKSEADH